MTTTTTRKGKGLLATSMALLWTLSSSSASTAAVASSSSSFMRGSSSNQRDGDTDTTRLPIVGRKLSMERCLQDKALAERSQIGVECMCKSKPDQGIVLVCSDQCAFCNDDQTVCGIKSTESLYDGDNGSRVGIGLVFEYLKPGSAMLDLMSSDLVNAAHVMGEDNTQEESPVVVLGIEEVGCEEDEETGQLMSCDTCNVYLGGSICESCELMECGEEGSGIIAPVMNCSNVQASSEFNFCEDVEMGNDSPFQAFLPRQFERCLPMEVLLPGAELITNPLGSNPSRPRTKDSMGNEVSSGLVIG